MSGQIALGAPAITEHAAVAEPDHAVSQRAAVTLWTRNGVFDRRTPLDIDDAARQPDYGKATLLIEDRSPTLADDHRRVPEVEPQRIRGDHAALAGAGRRAEATADDGLEVAARDTARTWGIAPELYVARDGSGLSRNDYLTADALTAVLTAIWRDPRHVDAFRSALPVAGVSGTLANQLKDTPAAAACGRRPGRCRTSVRCPAT